jgi:hypothetical protein
VLNETISMYAEFYEIGVAERPELGYMHPLSYSVRRIDRVCWPIIDMACWPNRPGMSVVWLPPGVVGPVFSFFFSLLAPAGIWSTYDIY